MHQAVGQFRLVERRVGIGRHDDRGHAAGDGGGQFRLDAVEAGAEVDKSRTDDTTRRIDALIGREPCWRLTQCGNPAIRDE